MSIRAELQQFDGKHTDVLEEILATYRPTNSFVVKLVTLLADENEKIQTGATWMLKKLAEDHYNFKLEHLIALFGSVPELTHWLSKLHVCQMLKYVEIPGESVKNIVWFLERNVEDENRFVRAWCYNGFYELARQHQNYFDYAMEQLERGESDRAASVKARIRNIRKAMNKKVP